MTLYASCIQELDKMRTTGVISNRHTEKAVFWKGIEQDGVQASEGTLTIATIFLTAFRVHVRKGAKREQAFNCMHTDLSKSIPRF